MTAKITKEEATKKGLVRFFTGSPCIRGHISERRVSSGECVECNLENARKHKASQKWKDSYQRRISAKKADGTYSAHLVDRWLRSTYKLSRKQFDMMVHVQNNQCAICGFRFIHDNRMTKPHIDHCHESGKIRGLLCSSCNKGIGQFKDNVAAMRSAIEYVQNQGVLN